MKAESELALTFTVEEWRLIAVACHGAERVNLMDKEHNVPKLVAIAHRIAIETGKDDADAVE